MAEQKKSTKRATKTTKKKAAKKTSKKRMTRDVKAEELGICFTIMPFGGWFDDYYASVYRPAIEAAGMEPKRADDLYRPSTIVNDIWSYTQQATMILADLTGKNPNVFYELGLAHALAKPAILITESMDDVPFDLRALRVIEYDKNNPDWGESLQSNITKAIKEIKDAPLESVLPAFLAVKTSTKKKELTESEKEVLELRRDMDILRHELLRNRGSRIDKMDAEALVKAYVARNMPTHIIVRKLVGRGVPEDWIIDKIDGLAK